MPTPTYIPISSITLTGTAASVTFSSIPQTFKDLIIVSNQMSVSDAVDGNMQFNGDTTNYTRVFVYGNGSAIGFGANSTAQAFVPRVSPGVLEVQIMDYSSTDKNKVSLLKSNQGTYITYLQASKWANNSAVTSILLSPASSSWAAGATFSLYGIHA